MENIRFEIHHDLLLAIVAKRIDVPVSMISLHLRDELAGGSVAVSAVVRTDLQTANKIDRKLKRLGVEQDSDEQASDA